MPRAALHRLRLLVPTAAWALGFALTSWLAGRCLPAPELPQTIREKLAHLAAHGDDYDAIFVGSSRIQNHVMPGIFDRLAAEGGSPVKSFNAGVASTHTPEDAWMLDQILARRPAHLRWVFLEIDFFETALQEGQRDTARSTAWHDWPRFAVLCRRLFVLKDLASEVPERVRDFTVHLAAFGQHSTQFGRGAQLFDGWRHHTPAEPMDWARLGTNGDGWVPTRHDAAALAESPATLTRLAGLVAERQAKAPKPRQSDRVTQAVLGEAIAKILRAGAVPILVIPPRTRSFYFVPSEKNARLAAVIDLCNPARYPELYAPQYRVDTSHLNAAGAEVFTRILAARFLEIAPREPAPATSSSGDQSGPRANR